MIGAGGAAVASLSPAAARAQAHQIVSERRFSPPPLPDPLRGVLRWIASVLESIGRAIDGALHALAKLVPGGLPVAWVAFAAAIVALVAAAVTLAGLVRPRARAIGERSGARADGDAPVTAAELERAAAAAERAGDAATALRLRFQAGLLALVEREAIAPRESSLPSGQIAVRLRSPPFDALARRFDEVVYGGSAANADDARAAREGWRTVLSEVDAR